MQTEVTLAELGRQLFFDEYLSDPPGQSCASCHQPVNSFADPDSVDNPGPVSSGVISGRFALRNTPSITYAAYIPGFRFDENLKRFVGGLFLDGRATDLEDQARQPFVNPLEMNNTSEANVVRWVRNAEYAEGFDTVFGNGALNDNEQAFRYILSAIAAFERSGELSPFTSKFDAVLAGRASFTTSEQNGFELFHGKADCARCHQGEISGRELFSKFQYENIGVPRNPANPFYTQPAEFNPDGIGFVDLGLGGNTSTMLVRDGSRDGKFRNPTLRNVELTAPYMHNGVFNSLEDVLAFFNSRDVDGIVPEVAVNREDMNAIGELGLSQQEISDLVAFMKTLTDGYF